MSSITTRTGDDGTTGLVFGQRVPKSHLRIEAVGRLDEFNAALGFAKASSEAGGTREGGVYETLETMQRDLIAVMGELAAADADAERYQQSRFDKLTPDGLAHLDGWIAALEARQLPFDGWATPGRTLPRRRFGFGPRGRSARRTAPGSDARSRRSRARAVAAIPEPRLGFALAASPRGRIIMTQSRAGLRAD